MEEHGGRRWPVLVVLAASPFQGHMTPTLQLAKALHANGFSIAIAHSKLNPPNPSNHPSFIFLPLSDNLSVIDDSGSFSNFIHTLNKNCKPSFQKHMTRLIGDQNKGNKSIVVIYDNLMFCAGSVAADLNLVAIVFRSCSAAYFPANLVRQQLHQESRYLYEMVPNHHPLRYKDLPFSKPPIEDWQQLFAIISQSIRPSAVIWNTIKVLEHEALTQIQKYYQVPVFSVGPLHKITPTDLPTSFLEEDTSYIAWLDKQATKSVIYISFGSLMTLDKKVLTEMACGIAKSNQRFIRVVRPGSVCDSEWTEFLPEGFIEETRERGLIVKYHCGWNSTLESISEGIPMICQPFNVDQMVNARYVSYVWKIGLELEDLKTEEMESMIRRVMVDEEGEEMRVRAIGMKEMVKEAVQNGGCSYDSLEELVGFISSC
ncbi:hypothetical protein Lser_V15G15117 [Lactuca serriola]